MKGWNLISQRSKEKYYYCRWRHFDQLNRRHQKVLWRSLPVNDSCCCCWPAAIRESLKIWETHRLFCPHKLCKAVYNLLYLCGTRRSGPHTQTDTQTEGGGRWGQGEESTTTTTTQSCQFLSLFLGQQIWIVKL